jgi:hypothetical protein
MRMIYINNFNGRLTIDFNQKPTKDVFYNVLQSNVKQRRYMLIKTYLMGIPNDQIRTTSPGSYMIDAQWNELVQKWSDPKTWYVLSAELHSYLLLPVKLIMGCCCLVYVNLELHHVC